MKSLFVGLFFAVALCGAVSASAGDFALDTVDEKPRCGATDKNACNEQCRSEFADGFKFCVGQCMSKRCVVMPESTPAPVAERRECVEHESAACANECRGMESSRGSRCRRSCLMQRCPDAPPADISHEGADPGITGCRRCRSEHEMSCRRDCALGVFGAKQIGLAQLGCEKACLMGYCSKECGTRIP